MKRLFHYTAILMGPCSLDWFKERGLTRREVIDYNGTPTEVDTVTEPYSAGRIEIQGPDGYDEEIAVPPIKHECWSRFDDYLWQLRTDEPKTLAELVEMYEEHSGRDIEFYQGNDG